jgi:hypothetical protein
MVGTGAGLKTAFLNTSIRSARFDYFLEYDKTGTPGYRTGSILAVTNGVTVSYTHTNTNTIGSDSTACVISAILDAGKLQLEMSTGAVVSATRVKCYPIY